MGKPRREEDTRRSTPPDLLPAALVAAVTLLAFLPALRGGFVWDDQANLVVNPIYRHLGLRQLQWMFTTFFMGPYQPLSWLSYWMDFQLWGMDPAGYHLTNLILHAANAVLLYLIAQRIQPQGRLSVLAALLFSVHPLRAESVAWITERRDVLSGFFYLLTVLFYLRDRRKPALAAFVCSLLSKGIGITLPLVLLVLDAYPLRRRPDIKGKLPFFAAAAVAGAAGIFGQARAGAMDGLNAAGPAARTVEALYGLSFYLLKTLLPFHLLPLYQTPAGILEAPWILSAGAGLAVGVGFFAARRSFPAGLAAWACYALTLLPVLGLAHFGLQIVADRYSYLSCLGWAILAAAGLQRLEKKTALGLGSAAVLILGVLTWRQAGIWRDEADLWRYAVSVDPSQSIPHNKLGNALINEGKWDEASNEFKRALAIDPNYAMAHNNLGRILASEGMLDEAVRHYREALRIKPDYPLARMNLGQALAGLGKFKEAEEQYRLARNPGL